MRISWRRRLAVTVLTLLLGQCHAIIGSARAELPAPVTVDLLDLTMEVAQSRANAQILDDRVRLSQQEQRKGYARLTAMDHETLRIDREVAHQKVKLLQLIVEAELAATAARRDFHQSQLKGGYESAIVDVRAAELRQKFLQELLKIASEGSPQPEQTAIPSQAGEGRFTGVVAVVGDVPKRAENAPLPDESLLVGPDGGLANVFVFLAEAPTDVNFPMPDAPVVLTSQNNRIHPHCAIVRTGQDIRLLNREAVANNFHVHPLTNAGFNQVIAPNDPQGVTIRFERSERVPVLVSDDIHPWKRAYLLVLDHPFVTLTDEEGRFEIDSLAPGQYRFRFWHEKVGFLEREHPVVIGEDGFGETRIEVDAERLTDENRGG